MPEASTMDSNVPGVLSFPRYPLPDPASAPGPWLLPRHRQVEANLRDKSVTQLSYADLLTISQLRISLQLAKPFQPAMRP